VATTPARAAASESRSVSGRRWSALAALAFATGVVATAATIAVAERHLRRVQRACDPPRPPHPPSMPWYALPLGVTGTALFAVAAVGALVAARRLARDPGAIGSGAGWWRAGANALLGLALLALLFAAWFGVYAVVSDAAGPIHCAG
jgi:tellurite resistance protein TehA-like permease